HILRHHRRAGLRLGRCRRHVEADRPRSAVGAFGRSPDTAMSVRVYLPAHLRMLAHVGSEVTLEVEGPVTQRSILDTLEASYPMLRRTIRDRVTEQRRP